MGFDDVQDNGLDVQNVGIISGFLCTEEEAKIQEHRLKEPEEGALDPADIGLEIGSFDDEEDEGTDSKPPNKH
jgi:hypothetical protein